MELDLHKFLINFIGREVKKLYISHLYSVEDLYKNNIISEEVFQNMRKRILDNGNDCFRNIEEQLNCFDFKLTPTDNKNHE